MMYLLGDQPEAINAVIIALPASERSWQVQATVDGRTYLLGEFRSQPEAVYAMNDWNPPEGTPCHFIQRRHLRVVLDRIPPAIAPTQR